MKYSSLSLHETTRSKLQETPTFFGERPEPAAAGRRHLTAPRLCPDTGAAPGGSLLHTPRGAARASPTEETRSRGSPASRTARLPDLRPALRERRSPVSPSPPSPAWRPPRRGGAMGSRTSAPASVWGEAGARMRARQRRNPLCACATCGHGAAGSWGCVVGS